MSSPRAESKGIEMLSSREDVESRWQSLVDHTMTREEVHEWAKPWVEDEGSEMDVMIYNALQRLHGFDLVYVNDIKKIVRHGGEGRLVHSDQDIATALQRWRANCILYDSDPQAYLENAKNKALLAIEAERHN